MLERGSQPERVIKVKRSSVPLLHKGLGMAYSDLKVLKRYGVYPGEESYPLRQGAPAIGLAALARQLQRA